MLLIYEGILTPTHPQARHRHPPVARAVTGAEEAQSPRAADCVASGTGTTARVRK